MTREDYLETITKYAIPKKERERILNEIREHNFSIVRLKGGDISFSNEDKTFIESLG